MTAEDRRRVREAIDEVTRARVLEPNRRLLGVMFCRSCGMDFSDWTPGCKTCADRWWGWRRRGLVNEQAYRERAEAGRAWGMAVAEQSNRDQPRRRNVRPVTTWAGNREALGVKNGGRLLRTPKGLV